MFEKANISGDPGILSGNAEEKGADLWGNAILYSARVPLAAGHSDDVSLTDDPAKGWGWLADKGFDIIQTDWTKHCVDYLKENNYRK